MSQASKVEAVVPVPAANFEEQHAHQLAVDILMGADAARGQQSRHEGGPAAAFGKSTCCDWLPSCRQGFAQCHESAGPCVVPWGIRCCAREMHGRLELVASHSSGALRPGASADLGIGARPRVGVSSAGVPWALLPLNVALCCLVQESFGQEPGPCFMSWADGIPQCRVGGLLSAVKWVHGGSVCMVVGVFLRVGSPHFPHTFRHASVRGMLASVGGARNVSKSRDSAAPCPSIRHKVRCGHIYATGAGAQNPKCLFSLVKGSLWDCPKRLV